MTTSDLTLAAAVLEAMPGAVLFSDAAGRVLAGNTRALELFSCDADALAGRSVDELLTLTATAPAAPQDSPIPVERRDLWAPATGHSRSGPDIDVDVSVRRIEYENTEFFVTLVRSVRLADRPNDLARRVVLVAERDRIAHGLQDILFGRIFGIGLALHASTQLPPEQTQERLEWALREFDATIRDLQRLVYSLYPEAADQPEIADSP